MSCLFLCNVFLYFLGNVDVLSGSFAFLDVFHAYKACLQGVCNLVAGRLEKQLCVPEEGVRSECSV